MKKISFVLIATALVSSLSCQVVKDADQALNVRGGKCELKKTVGLNLVIIHCFDFIEGYDANTAAAKCSDSTVTTDLESVYASIPINGVSWTSGDGNGCDTSNTVGSCTVASTGTMYYYNNGHWNAGTAQADCIGANLGGTWVP